jgi:hypothetical protein
VSEQRVVKIIVPRNNVRDVLACETFLSALVGEGIGDIALELAATSAERMFLVRGEPHAVGVVLAQLANAYPQCDFHDLCADADPARADATARQAIELRLREPAYLPLRTAVSREGRSTYDDFDRAADSMIALLGAMDGLGEGETCLLQLALAPLPDDWSKYWRGAAGDVNQRAKSAPQGLLAGVLNGLGIMLTAWGMIALAFSISFHLPAVIAVLGVALAVIGIALLILRFRIPSPPDPLLVRQKINQAAYRVQVRIFAFAADEVAAMRTIRRLQAALRGYNLAGANGFIAVVAPLADPLDVHVEDASLSSRLPLIYSLFASRRTPILNISEVASLWHLPHASSGLQGIAYTTSKRIAPIPRDVAAGVFVGHSRREGREVEVRLSPTMLRGNIGLVAKTQSGKSNLMAILASDVIANDPDATVIVVDPHRSLAQKVASLVPASREAHTIYWSLADRERPFGLNLIDRMSKDSELQGRALTTASMLFADKRVSDVIDAFNEIWPQNWGPRMEDYLRGPLLTMAAANEALRHNWEFEQWFNRTLQAFVANAERIKRGDLDALALRMIGESIAAFRQLRPPLRPSRLRLHKKLTPLFDAFDGATQSAMQYVANAENIRGQVVKQIDEELRAIPAPGSRPARGTGLASRLYQDEQGPWRPLQYTLLDVNPMLANAEMRLTALGGLDPVRDSHIAAWWRDSFDIYQKINPRLLMDMMTPVRTKMNRFRASDIARRIFGQPESTIDLPALINDGGILIIDLASGVIGQETAALIGSAILNWIASIIFARQDDRPQTTDGSPPSSAVHRRIFLVIDEFQSIPGADYAFMLSELGKFGVQLCMGTQSLGLLDEMSRKTRRAWLDNTSALFVFRAGADDARDLARELSTGDEDALTISPADIVGLPEFSCFARLRGVPMPFRIDTRRVEEGCAEKFKRVVAASMLTYGRDAEMVNKWLQCANELQGKDTQSQH